MTLLSKESRIDIAAKFSEGLQLKPIRVLQWNVLADGLAQNGDFVKVSPHLLTWENRGQRLLKLLQDSDADLICLQEVNHYDDFLLPELQSKGYSGIFFAKDPSAAMKYGFPADGIAVFVREERFSITGHEASTYESADGQKMSQGSIICDLVDKESGHSLVLATTHLKAKKGEENEEIRAMQAKQLLECLSQRVNALRSPVILCGDLNTSPSSITWRMIVEHPLDLRSAFAETSACADRVWGRAPGSRACGVSSGRGDLFTTWKFRSMGEAKAVIDYVWYGQARSLSRSRLQLLRHHCLPNEEEIGENGLPSAEWPSDHLPLVCQLSFVT